MSDEIINFKKINFYNKSFNSIFLKINKGGYLVAPAASSLSKIYENKIYYYSGVNRETVVELNHKLSELEAKHLTVSNVLEIDPPPIRLFINSGGGSIIAGIASMDTISRWLYGAPGCLP